MEFVEERFGQIAAAQAFFDDGFGNGVGRKIEPFAESFLQEPKEGGEESVGFPGGGVAAQVGEAVLDFAVHFALAAQARVVGKGFVLASDDEEREPGDEREGLEREKPWLRNKRRSGNGRDAEVRFDVEDFVIGDGGFLGGATPGNTARPATGRTVSGTAGPESARYPLVLGSKKLN